MCLVHSIYKQNMKYSWEPDEKIWIHVLLVPQTVTMLGKDLRCECDSQTGKIVDHDKKVQR